MALTSSVLVSGCGAVLGVSGLCLGVRFPVSHLNDSSPVPGVLPVYVLSCPLSQKRDSQVDMDMD